MKLANALLALALVATASAIYLGRRDPTIAAPETEQPAASRTEHLSTDVVELQRELAAMKAQIAMLRRDRTKPERPAEADPQVSASESSQQ